MGDLMGLTSLGGGVGGGGNVNVGSSGGAYRPPDFGAGYSTVQEFGANWQRLSAETVFDTPSPFASPEGFMDALHNPANK